MPSSNQPASIYWMYRVYGKSNQRQNRIAGFVPRCRCVCVCGTLRVCACAHCVRQRARGAARKILGERQRIPAGWGLFWWRGSINIALLPSRLLVCLSRTSTMLHHTPHTTHHTYNAPPWLKKKTARAVNGCVRQRPRCFILPHTGIHRMRTIIVPQP